MHPPHTRGLRRHRSPARVPQVGHDHPFLSWAAARHRHPFGLPPLSLHLDLGQFGPLLTELPPPGVDVRVIPNLALPSTPLLDGPLVGVGGLAPGAPAATGSPFRLDWQTDVGVGGPLNRRGGATFSADVAVSLVYEFDAVSFGACRADGHSCFADFLHEPTGTVTISRLDGDSRAVAWAASASIAIVDLHVLRDARNEDRLELSLPASISYGVDPDSGASVSGQVGVSAEVHVNRSVSVVVSGNVTFTPDANGVAVGAGGTATLLIHGS